jgi:hypothetical protein
MFMAVNPDRMLQTDSNRGIQYKLAGRAWKQLGSGVAGARMAPKPMRG